MINYESIQNLNDLEVSLYNYIVKNRNRVIKMTIRELANEAHVSTTTILRVCKKLGCEGFSEFKVKFKIAMEEERFTYISNDTNEIINFLKYIENSELDDVLEKVSKIVKECENIIFIGSSTSGVLAQYGSRILSSIGKFASYMDDPYFPMASNYYKNSIVFALSVSGETKTTLEYISKFKSEGSIIVSITNMENCTAARMSDYNLSYYIHESRYANNNITSQIPVVYMIERIAKIILSKKD